MKKEAIIVAAVLVVGLTIGTWYWFTQKTTKNEEVVAPVNSAICTADFKNETANWQNWTPSETRTHQEGDRLVPV